ncbi:Sulfate adenylyltransferase [Frankliniella fusca]|uniref:Sulfate adenylyltransferase n=1 Tax=Frankliniella fusca TaxID=407009 RepID=A0AAE1GUU1_9NEOP|nr:Sulfate adenylyltransferase [Frankliniella fusca]
MGSFYVLVHDRLAFRSVSAPPRLFFRNFSKKGSKSLKSLYLRNPLS